MLSQLLADLAAGAVNGIDMHPDRGADCGSHEIPDLGVGGQHQPGSSVIPKPAKVFRELPGVPIPPGATDQQAAEALVGNLHDNIMSVFFGARRSGRPARRHPGWAET